MFEGALGFLEADIRVKGTVFSNRAVFQLKLSALKTDGLDPSPFGSPETVAFLCHNLDRDLWPLKKVSYKEVQTNIL